MPREHGSTIRSERPSKLSYTERKRARFNDGPHPYPNPKPPSRDSGRRFIWRIRRPINKHIYVTSGRPDAESGSLKKPVRICRVRSATQKRGDTKAPFAMSGQFTWAMW